MQITITTNELTTGSVGGSAATGTFTCTVQDAGEALVIADAEWSFTGDLHYEASAVDVEFPNGHPIGFKAVAAALVAHHLNNNPLGV